jgi:hypothetical protein
MGTGFETGCGVVLAVGGGDGGWRVGTDAGGVVLEGGEAGGGVTGDGGLGLPPEESLCPPLPKSVVHQITWGSL